MKLTLLNMVLAALLCSQQAPAALTISATNGGGWGDMDWWFVEIDPSGRMEAVPRGAAATPVLSKEAMGGLRRLIEEERLFDLQDSYGNPCPECSVCMLHVKLGTREKTIDVGTHIEAAGNDREREELTRVMKVWDKLKELAGIAGREDACHAPDR